METGYTEIEEQEGTRIEKALLVGLIAFLLLGGYWTLDRIENIFPEPVLQSYNGYSPYAPKEKTASSIEDEQGVTPLRGQVAKYQDIATNRQATLDAAISARQKAQSDYEFRREEYRTAMQAGHSTPTMQKDFESSRATFRIAETKIPPAKADADAASKQLESEQHDLKLAEERALNVFNARSLQRNLKVFALTFSFALICLGFSWTFWVAGKKKRWRFQSIFTSLFIASLIQLVALLFRDSWGFFLEDYALLAVSLIGTIVTLLAIIAIKKWIYSPDKLTRSRLAAHRCPGCATTYSDGQICCWNCGRALMQECNVCSQNRLILAKFCGNCGAGPA